MVATWNPAASSGYYTQQSEYYTRGREPQGIWYAPASDLGVSDGTTVDTAVFERLFAGRDKDGNPLLTNLGVKAERVPAFDVTFSMPRSAVLVWALADDATRLRIEAAQAAAVRATLRVLEREATFARRGRGGNRVERVALTAACFQHGESRPAEHADGRTFADPNIHTHCVVMNAATRADGTVGALHSVILRNWKLSAGSLYHATLAAELQALGFELEEIGKNGIFEIAGVPPEAIRFFSARRAEIEKHLREAGTTSGESVALAAAIARSTRGAKSAGVEPRETVWRRAAADIGFDVAPVLARHRDYGSKMDRASGERLLAERIAALPQALTETRSVIDRRELVRSAAEVLVGTGISAERVDALIAKLINSGHVVELGQDAVGQPRYSTSAMVRIEREVVAMADRLVRDHRGGLDPDRVRNRCQAHGLSAEQTDAALAATGRERLAVVQGAPGTGKTTTLSPVVEAWSAAGYRVVGTATAWQVANSLHDDLGIEARAVASWLRRDELGMPFLDEKSILIIDEAGLIASREMHTLLTAVEKSQARMVVVGDLGQLANIGAGSGLKLLSRVIKSAHVTTIVRQHKKWAREAVVAFGRGDAENALRSFATREQLVEAHGQRAAIRAVIDAVDADIVRALQGSALIIAKTNAEVAAIGLEVRRRMRERGLLRDADVPVDAVTPSGHRTRIAIAAGDRLRFLARNDTIGVINGSTATVMRVMPVEPAGNHPEQPQHARIEAMFEGHLIAFDTRDLADDRGRARINWGYATTIYGAQGATVDRAAVFVSTAFDRHDIYVAASRARETTTLVIDQRTLNREISVQEHAAAPPAPAHAAEADRLVMQSDARLAFLAIRLNRTNVKETTLDLVATNEIVEAAAEPPQLAQREGGQPSPQTGTSTSSGDGQRLQRRRELGLEL